MTASVGIRIAIDGAPKAAADAKQVGDAVSGIGSKAAAAADGSSRLAGAIGKVARYGLAGSAVFAVATAFREAGAAMFAASASAQRLATTLNFATAGNAARELSFLRGLTDSLGIGFADASRAYANFQAAARGTSLAGAGARDVFEGVAGAAATLGLSASDTSGVLLALQQMISKGTVQAEELRGQLGERLPGAFGAAARAMGVTEGELGKMLERGEVLAVDLLPKLAKVLKDDFAGAAETAATRLDAAAAKLGNAWDRLKAVAGDAGVSQSISSGMKGLTDDMTAVGDAMKVAGASGGGAFVQWTAGVTTLIGRAIGLRGVTDAFDTLGTRLANAEREFAQLQERVERSGGMKAANIYLRSSFAEAERDVQRLRALKAQLDPGGGPTSGDEARFSRAAQGSARSKEEDAARAASLVKAREFFKSDIAIRAEWAAKAVQLTKAYSDAIAAAVDPAGAAALRAEMLAAAKQLTADLDAQLAAAAKSRNAPDFSVSNARATRDQQAFADAIATATQDLQTSIAENERQYKLGLRGLNDYVTRKYGLEQDLLDNEARIIESRLALAEKRKVSSGAEEIDRQREIDSLRAELARARAKKSVAATPQQDLFERDLLESREDAKRLDEQIARNDQERRQAAERQREAALGSVTALIEANRAGNIAMERDDRRRGEAQIALFREQKQAKVRALAEGTPEYERAQAAINEAVRLKQSELTESLKPEWQRMLEGWQDTAKLMQQAMDNAMTGTLKGAEDAFVSLVTTGKVNLKSLAKTVIAEFARMQFRQAIAGLAKMFAGVQGGGAEKMQTQVGALGMAFAGDSTRRFATGGVVTTPTAFRFAQGGSLRNGLMGEAGPEAIMPLKRTADGSLGVVAQGGGGGSNVTIHVANGDVTAQTVRMMEDMLAKYDRRRRQNRE